jgi:uncharacterized protein YbcI
MSSAGLPAAVQAESEAVLSMRRLYQRSMARELKQGIEAITGREVVAFMSDSTLEPDMAVETFILDRPLG